jgi:WD and tetratricopeptide repeat-containing protein 1
MYFAPGHLPPRLSRDFPRRLRAYVSTYVTFSPDGNEVIANLGGEQIYLFDIRKPVSVVGYNQFNGFNGTKPFGTNGVVKDVIDSMSPATCDSNSNIANGTTNGFKIPSVNGKTHLNKATNGHSILKGASLCKELPPKALELKARGNDAFCKQQFWTAVNAYNEAINLAPNSAILYANRAAAYIKRAW